MLQEKMLNKIKNLSEIRPNENWASSLRQEILDSTPAPTLTESFLMSIRKPAMVLAPTFVLLFGLFISAQNTIPGDPLFVVKRTIENSNALFLSKEKKAEYNLHLANKRLEELSIVSTKNEVERLNSTLEELKNAKKKIEAEFAKQVKEYPQEKAIEIAKVTSNSLTEIEEKEIIYLETLGARAGSNEESSNKVIAEFMLNVMKEKELNEEDSKLLIEAEEYYQNKEYSLTLRKLWQIGEEERSENLEEVQDQETQ